MAVNISRGNMRKAVHTAAAEELPKNPSECETVNKLIHNVHSRAEGSTTDAAKQSHRNVSMPQGGLPAGRRTAFKARPGDLGAPIYRMAGSAPATSPMLNADAFLTPKLLSSSRAGTPSPAKRAAASSMRSGCTIDGRSGHAGELGMAEKSRALNKLLMVFEPEDEPVWAGGLRPALTLPVHPDNLASTMPSRAQSARRRDAKNVPVHTHYTPPLSARRAHSPVEQSHARKRAPMHFGPDSQRQAPWGSGASAAPSASPLSNSRPTTPHGWCPAAMVAAPFMERGWRGDETSDRGRAVIDGGGGDGGDGGASGSGVGGGGGGGGGGGVGGCDDAYGRIDGCKDEGIGIEHGKVDGGSGDAGDGSGDASQGGAARAFIPPNGQNHVYEQTAAKSIRPNTAPCGLASSTQVSSSRCAETCFQPNSPRTQPMRSCSASTRASPRTSVPAQTHAYSPAATRAAMSSQAYAPHSARSGPSLAVVPPPFELKRIHRPVPMSLPLMRHPDHPFHRQLYQNGSHESRDHADYEAAHIADTRHGRTTDREARSASECTNAVAMMKSTTKLTGRAQAPQRAQFSEHLQPQRALEFDQEATHVDQQQPQQQPHQQQEQGKEQEQQQQEQQKQEDASLPLAPCSCRAPSVSSPLISWSVRDVADSVVSALGDSFRPVAAALAANGVDGAVLKRLHVTAAARENQPSCMKCFRV
eukprot:3128706-Pleurochrysis_carterae.AAC.1